MSYEGEDTPLTQYIHCWQMLRWLPSVVLEYVILLKIYLFEWLS